MAINTSAVEDKEELGSILDAILQKRDEESEKEQTPKLLEAKRLHAKAIQMGISRLGQLGVKKVDSYYPVLGGFSFILVTNNTGLTRLLEPSGLAVHLGCPYCVSSPCVMSQKFTLSPTVKVMCTAPSSRPRCLSDIFDDIMQTDKPIGLKRKYGELCAMDALRKVRPSELPLCVSGDILDW